MIESVPISPQLVPRLAKGFRLVHDHVRARWVIQAPERLFVLDATASAILQRCDGVTDLGCITDALASLYDAPRDVIWSDVAALIDDFRHKGVMLI